MALFGRQNALSVIPGFRDRFGVGTITTQTFKVKIVLAVGKLLARGDHPKS